ncbi:DUF6151 family protein [uncultured Tateyamaria sp.]|uniref:DUF6151 family protein n=1 Tax=uncultured Tateyamaria sp. TaxID=455651 RepID=UPI00260D57B3|nr:DUF6151 family protein [uncultured Tateyamaria sp.]
MAGVDLPFSCTCGTVRGTLRGVSPGNGNRVDCYCGDCRAAIVFADPDNSAPDGPVQLYQTTPNRIHFEAGADQLAVFSLSPKGILRWHARCCGAMLFNTLRSPKVAFAAFFTDRTPDASPLGPVKTRANVQKGDGTSYHDGLRHAVLTLARNAIPARLTGGWKATPFFDPATLEPVAEIYVLSKDERAAATAPQG